MLVITWNYPYLSKMSYTRPIYFEDLVEDKNDRLDRKIIYNIELSKKFKDRYKYKKRSKAGYCEYEPKGRITALEVNKSFLKKFKLKSEFYFESLLFHRVTGRPRRPRPSLSPLFVVHLSTGNPATGRYCTVL